METRFDEQRDDGLASGKIVTINVPVVFMARYIMVLRGGTSLREALEVVGPENLDFFGPLRGALEGVGPDNRDFFGS